MGEYAAKQPEPELTHDGQPSDKTGASSVPKTEFQNMDRDGDGSVTKEEFLWYVSPDDFKTADRNNDGVLDKEEFISAPLHDRGYQFPPKHMLEKEFKKLTKAGNGKLT